MPPLPTRRGDLLVVPSGARLPKVCLKCGARKDVVRREGKYTIGGLGQSGGIVGGAVAAAMGPMLRGMERPTAVAVFGAVIVVLGGGAWLLETNARKHVIALPLCKTCDAAWAEGETLRTRFVAALLASFALLAAGYAFFSTPLLVVGGLLFVLALAMTAAARLPARFVASAGVGAAEVTLRIDPGIADDLVARAKKRAEREAAKSDEADEET